LFCCAAKKVGICQQKHKLTVFVLQRSKNLGVYQQKQPQIKFILSCCAAKSFWDLPTRTSQIDCISFCRAEKIFGIATKSCILFSRAVKLLSCDQKHCILFSCAAKDFGIATKSTVFCSANQLECFWSHFQKVLASILSHTEIWIAQITSCGQRVFGVMSLCVLGSVWVGGGVWVIGCCE
jgi:hypothetical protein